MIIRAEGPDDLDAIRAVQVAAFPTALEADLVDWLRADKGWIQALSLVAVEGDVIIGHVVATRAHVGGQPALGLGPIGVAPEFQGTGVGSALMRAVISKAEDLGETLIGLLGEPSYYSRFGFVPASQLGVSSPDPEWGDYFQARGTAASGTFRYAEPFDRLG